MFFNPHIDAQLELIPWLSYSTTLHILDSCLHVSSQVRCRPPRSDQQYPNASSLVVHGVESRILQILSTKGLKYDTAARSSLLSRSITVCEGPNSMCSMDLLQMEYSCMSDVELEVPKLVQGQIQCEVEKYLQLPPFSTPWTLYELFDVHDLQPGMAEYKVPQLWRCHQRRPGYKDFRQLWSQAASFERAEIEFWYAYWYQEIRLLETIANLKGISLERPEVISCKSSYPLKPWRLTSVYKQLSALKMNTTKTLPYRSTHA